MMSFFFVKETQSCWSDPVHRGLKTRFFCRRFEVYSRERLRSFFPSKVSRYLMNRHHIISVPPRRTVSLWDSVLCLSQCPPYAVKDWCLPPVCVLFLLADLSRLQWSGQLFWTITCQRSTLWFWMETCSCPSPKLLLRFILVHQR